MENAYLNTPKNIQGVYITTTMQIAKSMREIDLGGLKCPGMEKKRDKKKMAEDGARIDGHVHIAKMGALDTSNILIK